MLDTNVFNDVVDGKIDIATLNGRRLIATHIQRDELNNTTDQKRRELLLAVFEFMSEDQLGLVPTESALWGVSKWDAAKWGADDGIVGAMRADLDARNKGKPNNAQDILIAETSLRNGWVLITADKDLFAAITKYGGACANAFILRAV